MTELVRRVAQAMLAHQMDCELMQQSPTWESRAIAAINEIRAALPECSECGIKFISATHSVAQEGAAPHE